MSDLKILEDLISIRSDNGCENIIKYIKSKLENETKEIRIVKDEVGKENIIIGINTVLQDIEPVVLSGHIDTVNADEKSYNTNPYKLTIKEGKAYGLGVIDMKCFTASIMELVDKIKEYKYPVVLALTTDEETNLNGIKGIIKEFKKLNIKPKFTIIGEPTSMKINNISNGCYEYKVDVFGKSCHSSTPENGINAICIVAKIITYIEELSNKYSDLVMNSNIISGGTIINRIPDYASVSFDIRTTNTESYKEVMDLLNEKIKKLEKEYNTKINIDKKLEIPPLCCKNGKEVNIIAKTLNLELAKFSGGCEAGFYEEYSGDAILFGVGDLSMAHKPNEYMIIDNYKEYNNILMELLSVVKDVYY